MPYTWRSDTKWQERKVPPPPRPLGAAPQPHGKELKSPASWRETSTCPRALVPGLPEQQPTRDSLQHQQSPQLFWATTKQGKPMTVFDFLPCRQAMPRYIYRLGSAQPVDRKDEVNPVFLTDTTKTVPDHDAALRYSTTRVNSTRMKERGKWQIPEKTRLPAAFSETIPTCENPGVTQPRIKSSSPCWEASKLTTLPPWSHWIKELFRHSNGIIPEKHRKIKLGWQFIHNRLNCKIIYLQWDICLHGTLVRPNCNYTPLHLDCTVYQDSPQKQSLQNPFLKIVLSTELLTPSMKVVPVPQCVTRGQHTFHWSSSSSRASRHRSRPQGTLLHFHCCYGRRCQSRVSKCCANPSSTTARPGVPATRPFPEPALRRSPEVRDFSSSSGGPPPFRGFQPLQYQQPVDFRECPNHPRNSSISGIELTQVPPYSVTTGNGRIGDRSLDRHCKETPFQEIPPSLAQSHHYSCSTTLLQPASAAVQPPATATSQPGRRSTPYPVINKKTITMMFEPVSPHQVGQPLVSLTIPDENMRRNRSQRTSQKDTSTEEAETSLKGTMGQCQKRLQTRDPNLYCSPETPISLHVNTPTKIVLSAELFPPTWPCKFQSAARESSTQ
ncbi:hypothetical protein PR048_029374 [Dryococelus australis]|uniref:Uncharacterized protein n=1 Tax=Dryococelus australis TaxID=614101 RepID=A0ABQ9GD79_9NEOP|nr:hypothetical protein PR048_029374 [Dryococelus australis]